MHNIVEFLATISKRGSTNEPTPFLFYCGGKGELTLSIICQILVGIILILIAVAPIIKQRRDSKKSKEVAAKKSEETTEEAEEATGESKEATNYKGLGFSVKDLMSCLLFTIGLLFICNGSVQGASELRIIIQSPLKYSDTILLLGTVFPTICVAYFQHQTQKKLNELNAIESKALSEKHEEELKRAERWHYDGLRSKAIQNFRTNSKIEGLTINFNLGQAQNNSEYKTEYGNGGCYISLGNDEGEHLFYPSYYHMEKASVFVKVGNTLDNIDDFSISAKRISFFIDNQQIKRKNLYQLAYNPFCIALSGCESILQIVICLYGEDRSMQSDNVYLGLNYSILLEIKPTSGYDNMGRFGVVAHSIEMSQLSYERSSIKWK